MARKSTGIMVAQFVGIVGLVLFFASVRGRVEKPLRRGWNTGKKYEKAFQPTLDRLSSGTQQRRVGQF